MEATFSELRQKGNDHNACISFILLTFIDFSFYFLLMYFLMLLNLFSLLGEGDIFSFYSPFFMKRSLTLTQIFLITIDQITYFQRPFNSLLSIMIIFMIFEEFKSALYAQFRFH